MKFDSQAPNVRGSADRLVLSLNSAYITKILLFLQKSSQEIAPLARSVCVCVCVCVRVCVCVCVWSSSVLCWVFVCVCMYVCVCGGRWVGVLACFMHVVCPNSL